MSKFDDNLNVNYNYVIDMSEETIQRQHLNLIF